MCSSDLEEGLADGHHAIGIGHHEGDEDRDLEQQAEEIRGGPGCITQYLISKAWMKCQPARCSTM